MCCSFVPPMKRLIKVRVLTQLFAIIYGNNYDGYKIVNPSSVVFWKKMSAGPIRIAPVLHATRFLLQAVPLSLVLGRNREKKLGRNDDVRRRRAWSRRWVLCSCSMQSHAWDSPHFHVLTASLVPPLTPTHNQIRHRWSACPHTRYYNEGSLGCFFFGGMFFNGGTASYFQAFGCSRTIQHTKTRLEQIIFEYRVLCHLFCHDSINFFETQIVHGRSHLFFYQVSKTRFPIPYLKNCERYEKSLNAIFSWIHLILLLSCIESVQFASFFAFLKPT